VPEKLPSTTKMEVPSSPGAVTVVREVTEMVVTTFVTPPSISTVTTETPPPPPPMLPPPPVTPTTGIPEGTPEAELGAGAGAAVDATVVVMVVVVTIGAVDPEKAGSLTTLSGRVDSDVARRPLRRVVEERGTHSFVAVLYLSSRLREETTFSSGV